ncbi:PTPS domain containing protein [Trichuris trichiura]|uniref:6-pyruvoyltetrahydropterin synthase n=1 Tax=Trichuris trichiura TaxID=36087 RepID=A0A077ZKX4_TRITR|nr:PTPS domain containing protein [Trichuris trichiura]
MPHDNLLSVEENAATFSRCSNPNGHWHNYKGMQLNTVIAPLDHKCLDLDVEFFKTHSITTENFTVYIWNQLIECMPKPDILYEVTVHETETNSVTYRGEVNA